MKFVATVGDQAHAVEVSGGNGRYRLTLGDEIWEVDARLSPSGVVSLLANGVSYVAAVSEQDGVSIVEVEGETYTVTVEEAARYLIRTRGSTTAGGGPQTLTAPMPGRITHVAVRPGDHVQAGATLLVIEAMKMENELRAATAGTVSEVRVQAGQPVNAGDVLLIIAG